MDIGPLIKFFRTRKRLTQSELARGICSVSHLSKIENNSKDANKETISLLLQKLNIDIMEITIKEEQIKQLIFQFNGQMNFYQKKEAKQTLQKLASLEDFIPFSKSLHLYELSKYRFYILNDSLKEIESQEAFLRKTKRNFSQYEEYLFQYYNALYFIKKEHYQKADSELELLLQRANPEFERGEVYYHRALVKSSLEQSEHAVYYGKKALQYFMNEHNFIRILHTLMLLGINYTHSKIYHEALDCFNHLMRNAELMNESEFLPQIYHNIGYLKAKMGNYPEAIHFYEKSLSYQTLPTLHRIVTTYSIGEIYYSLEKMDCAKEFLENTFEHAKKIGNPKYMLLSQYYLKAMTLQEEAILFLEMKVIPFLEGSKEHFEDLNQFYKLLSSHYQQQGRLEKAVKYIEKIY